MGVGGRTGTLSSGTSPGVAGNIQEVVQAGKLRHCLGCGSISHVFLEGHPPLAPGQGWVVATTLTRVYERSAWIVPRKKGVV